MTLDAISFRQGVFPPWPEKFRDVSPTGWVRDRVREFIHAMIEGEVSLKVGGVKRAPRGYSMGQMGQRARHG
jgi:hypothetical protein